LGDGTEVTDYANNVKLTLRGISGSVTATHTDYAYFAIPIQKTAADFVPWATLSASKPAFLQPLMDSWSAAASAAVVNDIKLQLNEPVNESITAWS